MPNDIAAIHHAGLHVRDIERSLVFYRDVLGLELLARRESHADYVSEIVGYPDATIRMAWLRHPSGGPIVELLEYVDPRGEQVDTATPNPGTVHLAFRVPDIHATTARLQAAGAPFRTPAPVPVTAGPNRGGFAIYFRDPDGISLELLQPPPDSALG